MSIVDRRRPYDRYLKLLLADLPAGRARAGYRLLLGKVNNL